MAVFDGMLQELIENLSTSSALSDMRFTTEYPLTTKPHPLRRIHVAVGLAKVRAANAALGEFLGVEEGKEVYGKRMEVGLKAGIYTPQSMGGAACCEAFSRLCDALFLQTARQFGVTGVECGQVRYDRDAGAFVLEAAIGLAAYIGRQSDDTPMGEIIVKGVFA